MIAQPKLPDEEWKRLPKKMRKRPSKRNWYNRQTSRASIKSANLENTAATKISTVSGGLPSLGKRR